MREHFPFFHAQNLKDCLNPGQRPKLELYDRYAFMVLLFPVYNRQTREIESSEIDFFIGKDFLVTVHDDKRPEVTQLFEKFQASAKSQVPDVPNVILTLADLVNQLLRSCFPMLDHISVDLHGIERQIFRGKEKAMVQEILITRRNIVDFRKIMQAHKNTIKKLGFANRTLHLAPVEQSADALDDAIEQSKDIWDNLEAFKESVEALQETNESLISFHLNDIMKTYTMISVVIFTLTLITTIFAANLPHTPLVSAAYGFYALLALLGIIAMGTIGIFKLKRWL